jgi:hypothetical protein
MSHPAAAFPFAYRLPTDAAVWIRDTDPALVTMGSSRRRLVVLVLTFLALAGGLAAMLPSGDAAAMVRQECVYDLDGGSNSTNDPLLCF